MTRREELLLVLDRWNKEHRRLADEAHNARVEKEAVEGLLREEQRAEIKALKAEEPKSGLDKLAREYEAEEQTRKAFSVGQDACREEGERGGRVPPEERSRA